MAKSSGMASSWLRVLVHGGVGRGRMGGGVQWAGGRLTKLGGKEVASSVSEGETGREGRERRVGSL